LRRSGDSKAGKKALARLPRQQQRTTWAYYHVMNRGHNREVVFQTDDDHAFFLSVVDRYGQRFPVRLRHDCLIAKLQLPAALVRVQVRPKPGQECRSGAWPDGWGSIPDGCIDGRNESPEGWVMTRCPDFIA
jgi:hypothetical protein